jgi:hypothetical protein
MSLQALFTSGSETDSIPVAVTLGPSGNQAGGLVEQNVRIVMQANSTVLGNDEIFGPVFNSMRVSGVAVVGAVTGSTSTALMIGKCTGSNVLGSAIPLATAVVVVSGSDWQTSFALIASTALLALAPGDRLAIIKSGVWQPPTQVLLQLQLTRL